MYETHSLRAVPAVVVSAPVAGRRGAVIHRQDPGGHAADAVDHRTDRAARSTLQRSVLGERRRPDPADAGETRKIEAEPAAGFLSISSQPGSRCLLEVITAANGQHAEHFFNLYV